MTVGIGIYPQTYLIDFDTHSSLQRQYEGFLETPQLLLNPELREYSDFILENAPQSIPADFKMPHPVRLGQRMEAFMAVALQNTYKICAKNLQIIHNKQTLGEFDFILNPGTGNRFIHLEMAYKFYLYRPEFPGNWTAKLQGPNKKDHLELKLAKLTSHQFPLLTHQETTPYMETLGVEAHRVTQQVFFKTQIFIPFDFDTSTLHQACSEAVVGTYYTGQQLNNLDHHFLLFFIPQKNNWVERPSSPNHFIPFHNFFKQVEPILEARRSCLFWVYNVRSKTFKSHFASWW